MIKGSPEEFSIRTCNPGDLTAIQEITFRTGFKGEDLTGKNFIDDQRLLFLIFIYYYPKYEPEHCFVAEEKRSGKVVGFICGTPDTERQENIFRRKMIWRIFFHTLTYTTWRYPRTFINLIRMSKIQFTIDPEISREIKLKYPAHLHINLLPEYQRLGLGTRLIHKFEMHLQSLGVSGVHLQTTSQNHKAVPFYAKTGYKLVHEANLQHFKFRDIQLLTYGKLFTQTTRDLFRNAEKGYEKL